MTVALSSRTAAASIPLAFRRVRLGELASRPGLLGARIVADAESADAVGAPLLAPAGGWADAWFGSADTQHGSHGCVRYATDGEWLYGAAVIDDSSTEGGLTAATHRAYAELFEVLARSTTPHLLRLWNYITDINVETGGIERYRQFNAGRQQAFLEAERSAFEGSPAACALGTSSGPLRVSFLAGRKAPMAIENPRQVSAYRYPTTYGPRAPTFSRAALADVGGARQALFISGTASIVGHETLHIGDVARQTQESLTNIAVLREIASQRAGKEFAADELIYTVYVRHREDLPLVRSEFERAVGPQSRAAREATYLHADICRAPLLVEIEAHGFIDKDVIDKEKGPA